MYISVIFIFISAVSASVYAKPHSSPTIAVASISNPKNAFSTVHGKVIFTQESAKAPVVISGLITGLPKGKHGFHVHVFGDIVTDGCDSSGDHFNPFYKNHGAPVAIDRHEGDLGNIIANSMGVASIYIKDPGMTMIGPQDVSILYRTIVVHVHQDDLGLTNNPESKTNGNSGARVGCGVIKLL